ncbi:UPF0182 family protein [Desulfitibacter alkalitolerans]|uniref:UPF0182 family membrane protein n=1 Tax=Desulfitibacter alkalitolerans TaxID=264641 RepID=UPI0004806807|nr:UPF0182 family protein [Desulfitibacter alkalitolerans]
MQFLLRQGLVVLFAVVIAIVYVFNFAINFYADMLWFTAMEYVSVLYTIVLSNIGVRLISFVLLFLIFILNLLITMKFIKFEKVFIEYNNQDVIPIKEYFLQKFFNRKKLFLIYVLISLFFAFLFSGITANQWLTVQAFFNANEFRIADPIFNKDISFYVFTLPFYRLLYALLVSAVVGSGILVSLAYFLFTPKNQFNLKLKNFKFPQLHISFIVALFFVLKAWSYKLNAFELLNSQRGVVFGAGYTDVVAQMPAFNIMAILSLVLAALIIISLFLKTYKIIMGSIIVFVASSILLGSVFPSAVQRFRVEPNEFVREAPYLEHSIAFTRKAFNLERIETQQFPVNQELTWEDIENNRSTIDNIRLWDPRPLRQTFEQLQTLRLYYEFKDVDIDRYWIDGEYRQVMLAAREMDQRQLQPQAQTWINQRLRYTHGYGVVMSAVNETTSEGLPHLFVKNFPPQSISSDLVINQPSIYFGELTTNQVIVNTNTKEFHYPSGNDNIETTYKGTGGVPIDSFFKRLFFAIYHGDFRLILTSEITKDSKILYNRDLTSIVNKIAPFLVYDTDPYIVISAGNLYWIRDAYTVTNMYPYSQTYGGFNYIRNSVKVVIDAYNGTTHFYISDPTDPIIKTYSDIFPELFKPMEDMPDGLRQHIRYPVYYFGVQARLLSLYHMQNPQVFYNREDAWTIPQEIFQGDSQLMEPYYMIMQLPGHTTPEFVLMLPFTPLNRANMVSWLAARSDGDHYGNLILYQFPKEGHLFGPMQIEARIDQDSEISQQLTLWDQRGSQVIRGNLLVIPIENSILYVEPIFLQAEQSKMPELRRVIVAYGDQIVMEETLQLSLQAIFGERQTPIVIEDEDFDEQIINGETTSQLITRANRLFNEAMERQKNGDWAGYGNAIKELENVLNILSNINENDTQE